MKAIYTLILMIFISGLAFGQNNNLKLKINPKIDNTQLTLTTGKYNAWNSVPYKITRLQYYIANITITHDGGKKTELTDLYLLTSPKTFLYTLGSQDIQNVESIEFYIGVDPKYNHGDPSLYPSTNPLGPQNPSMNWGWTAGYRFAAIEGYSDSGNGLYADKFEFHTIGDALFTKISLNATSAKDNNNNLVIELNANYNKLFNTIDLTGGMIVHGADSPNTIIMENFKEVFSSASVTATHEYNNGDFAVNYANPTSQAVINYSTQTDNAKFELLNLAGQQVYSVEHLAKTGEITVPNSLNNGMYILRFFDTNGHFYSNKIVLQK